MNRSPRDSVAWFVEAAAVFAYVRFGYIMMKPELSTWLLPLTQRSPCPCCPLRALLTIKLAANWQYLLVHEMPSVSASFDS